VITVENLTKSFQGVNALNGVTLDVEAGTVLGVVGPSGAGKSTLARCVALLERPDSGAIRVDGTDITALDGSALRAARRQIGVVPQGDSLLRQRTAAGNIALPQAGRRQFYPNVSVAGFTVADAWLVTPRLCINRIAGDPDANDGFFALPNRRFERTAHAVLNPSRDPAFDDFSQLEWLRRHHQDGDGVENLFLWLGSNNALGTIVRMDVRSTADAGRHRLEPVARLLDLARERNDREELRLWLGELLAGLAKQGLEAVALLVELTSDIQRMPDEGPERLLLGVCVPVVSIDAMTASAPSKVAIALDRMGLRF